MQWPAAHFGAIFIACAVPQASLSDVSTAVDLCLSDRASPAEFIARAKDAGIPALVNDDARQAYALTGDGVFMYRAADEQPTPEDAVALQSDIRAAIGEYWMPYNTSLNAIFDLGDTDKMFVSGTPASGVSYCRIYTTSAVPGTVADQLGPRTILTKAREPFITTRERPLDGRSQDGYVEATHTPSVDYFSQTLGTPLSFAHIIEIQTPAQK